ncbi:hypothetical protein C8R45DRAFT_832053, partial [Mycena sanguinolenta]
MLLILLAIHLSKDAAQLLYSLDTRRATNCDDIIINRCLTWFSVVWVCLTTMSACTWVPVYPNVPNESVLQHFWRRFKMTFIGMLSPEIMVGSAACQFFTSLRLSKEFKFSRTHSLFFCMSGFISSAGYPVATMEQLRDPALGSKFQEAIRNVSEAEIIDRCKRDALLKGVALVQDLWFVLQCFAHMHQHITVTQFDIATLAFAVVNVFTWSLWWAKYIHV